MNGRQKIEKAEYGNYLESVTSVASYGHLRWYA